MTNWLSGLLTTLFGRDDWTTVDPNIELKEWLDTRKTDNQGFVE